MTIKIRTTGKLPVTIETPDRAEGVVVYPKSMTVDNDELKGADVAELDDDLAALLCHGRRDIEPASKADAKALDAYWAAIATAVEDTANDQSDAGNGENGESSQ